MDDESGFGDDVADIRQRVEQDGHLAFLCMFAYAEGMLLSENEYHYQEGVPLEEYFFNTGKALGMIHRLSKQYVPQYPRVDYREKYNRVYIDELIPDHYEELKAAIFHRLTYDAISLHPKRRFMVYECFCYPISRLQRQL